MYVVYMYMYHTWCIYIYMCMIICPKVTGNILMWQTLVNHVCLFLLQVSSLCSMPRLHRSCAVLGGLPEKQRAPYATMMCR